ncbi:hypothetical protein MPSEU_000312200 [Mayamaea pseudoterrestris]|nr:hypothetical protein MPSEU_000312200 [Mayamaea pseudoterrestris]
MFATTFGLSATGAVISLDPRRRISDERQVHFCMALKCVSLLPTTQCFLSIKAERAVITPLVKTGHRLCFFKFYMLINCLLFLPGARAISVSVSSAYSWRLIASSFSILHETIRVISVSVAR